MIYIYRKSLLHMRCSSAVVISKTHKFCFLGNNPLSASSYSSLSLNPVSSTSEEQSFAVSYLINSCGLTPERAVSASKFVNLKTLDDGPDSVLSFFKNHGFKGTQISKIISTIPTLLSCNPKKTLLPKFEFFYSIGMSRTDLAQAFTSGPITLKRSLKKQIIPNYNFYRAKFHLDDNKFIAAFKRSPQLLLHDPDTTAVPNMEILRELGVPECNIMFLLTKQPRAFLARADKFKETVEEVKKLGLNPERFHFVVAVFALRSMNKLTWNKKLEVFRKWGWSDDVTILAFVKNPWCMTTSEEKIMAVMDFYVNVMGWESLQIAHRPKLLSLSLGKRIVPRCSVVQVLLSKGLIKKDISLPTLLESTESTFLRNFVTRYKEEAPQLLKLYQAKMDLSK